MLLPPNPNLTVFYWWIGPSLQVGCRRPRGRLAWKVGRTHTQGPAVSRCGGHMPISNLGALKTQAGASSLIQQTSGLYPQAESPPNSGGGPRPGGQAGRGCRVLMVWAPGRSGTGLGCGLSSQRGHLQLSAQRLCPHLYGLRQSSHQVDASRPTGWVLSEPRLRGAGTMGGGPARGHVRLLDHPQRRGWGQPLEDWCPCRVSLDPAPPGSSPRPPLPHSLASRRSPGQRPGRGASSPPAPARPGPTLLCPCSPCCPWTTG